MNKLNVKLENCYGIEKMEYEFDFSENNAIAIYARNGLMKTSFSKTLKKIQDNKNGEIEMKYLINLGSQIYWKTGMRLIRVRFLL